MCKTKLDGFLAAEYGECFEQARHYDSRQWELTKYAVTLCITVAAALLVLYKLPEYWKTVTPAQQTTAQGESGANPVPPPTIDGLGQAGTAEEGPPTYQEWLGSYWRIQGGACLLFAFLLLLIQVALAVNHLYFIMCMRQINAIRLKHVGPAVRTRQFENRAPLDPDLPSFSPRNIHSILLYGGAVLPSLFLAVGLWSFDQYRSSSLDLPVTGLLCLVAVATVAQILVYRFCGRWLDDVYGPSEAAGETAEDRMTRRQRDLVGLVPAALLYASAAAPCALLAFRLWWGRAAWRSQPALSLLPWWLWTLGALVWLIALACSWVCPCSGQPGPRGARPPVLRVVLTILAVLAPWLIAGATLLPRLTDWWLFGTVWGQRCLVVIAVAAALLQLPAASYASRSVMGVRERWWPRKA